jgi:superfamily I DNA and/or RNA helicase
MGLKYDLFYLAIHYWEGRWIMATKDLIIEDRIHKNGMADAQKRWQRFAMLSPCFVSTFFMAPKFFTFSKHVKTTGSKSIWDTPPLQNYIDLLIVDEAGQVAPEVGAATFALAKRALVIGDTLQIEPVWNVPAKVDHANLHRYKVISNISDQTSIADLQTKGFLSSACSIMQLAQKTTPYQLYPEMERGMMLIEHRRCFDEIIEYCNRLAYHGRLEPKKGSAKGLPFAAMQFHAVDGISTIRGGTSRANPEEASTIGRWILTNQQQLLDHYQGVEKALAASEKRLEKKLRLADIIGIITPFTGQKYELTAALRRAGINLSGLTIGTVHALQGAERPVILFSATYGNNDIGKSYFYDRGVNMLNVAVSRAKDIFILFGCREILAQTNKTPSSQLYRYIELLTFS